ncbi:hypothetical protein RhiirA4_516531 [Rhizophagus irregularis]|uniref:Uncharacterized protein n=1 Tax=Rhizophagus irregularis TaxID=588596 RepID=A0A2I1GFI6_9GLOM|nr:hypothetical protein RhiirA4_516531 [Rhizophagus irregularis]
MLIIQLYRKNNHCTVNKILSNISKRSRQSPHLAFRASEALRVLWGSPLKINNKNVKGFLTALFKYLPPERKSHIMHHGFNVTVNENSMFNLNYLNCIKYLDIEDLRSKRELVKAAMEERCKIEDFEDLAMKISYLHISMPKDVIDYLNGVMKRYSKNSSEFQYIKKELAKRDSCL